MVDPVSLITIAAVAGTSLIGKTITEQATKHLWERFITRLRDRASEDNQAAVILASPTDPEQVKHAVQVVDAAQDAELVSMAQHLTTALEKAAPSTYTQFADKIVNIGTNIGGIHFH